MLSLSLSGSVARSRRRRLMTSVKMMAASTMSPAATAKPPRVITSMPIPKIGKRMSPARIENGRVARTIRMVLNSRSVTRRTIATTMAASIATLPAPLMDFSMKSAWRYASEWTSICLPAGDSAKSARAFSISAVSFGVLPPGAFWTERITASRPLKDALPRRYSPLTDTSAISESFSEPPLKRGTGEFLISSSVSARAIWLMGISSPPTFCK